MISFAPIPGRRCRWIQRGLGHRLFPPSKTVPSSVPSDGIRTRSPVPLHCPLPVDGCLAPEKRLMVAVLDDALLTLARSRNASDRLARRLTAEVEEWIAADDPDWPFSFVNVCHALQLDPSCVRSRVARWRRETISPVTSLPSRRVRLNRDKTVA